MSKSMSDRERFPELFVGTDINRRECKRVVPMKVLVLGMMRTGSQSMRMALKELGYQDTYHMDSVIQNPRDSDMWQEALAAKYHGKGKKFEKKDWDQLLGHCQAVCDLPTAAFIPELFAAYPDAKVVIAERDPQKWYDSCLKTIIPSAGSRAFFILKYFDPVVMGRLMPMFGLLFSGLFGNKLDETPAEKRETWLRVYGDIHEEARGIVPKDQLLEFKLEQGWEPLCKFLGNEVPKTEFPHINESNSFGEKMDVFTRLAIFRVAKNCIPVLGALGGVVALASYALRM